VRRRWIVICVVLALPAIGAGVASCAADSGTGPVPAGAECQPGDDCADGTTCVERRCVAEPCRDEDGDGAGIGPGCTRYDCDDSDPTVPIEGLMEECNERDDDCDNAIDEGCPCLDPSGAPLPDGESRPCGGGLGDCMGTQTCEGGLWSECDARSPREREICFNDLDDNCDGMEDEGCCPEDEFPCTETAMCSSSGMCL